MSISARRVFVTVIKLNYVFINAQKDGLFTLRALSVLFATKPLTLPMNVTADDLILICLKDPAVSSYPLMPHLYLSMAAWEWGYPRFI